MTRAAARRAQGLGLQFARQLADAGARCLVLTSRAPRLSAEALAALARPGAAAFVVAADAGNEAHTARVAAWAREALPAVAHYAHAAGVSGHAPLADMTAAQLGAVLGPKVRRAGIRRGGAGARQQQCWDVRLAAQSVELMMHGAVPGVHAMRRRCSYTAVVVIAFTWRALVPVPISSWLVANSAC